jgi:hypothetical protein
MFLLAFGFGGMMTAALPNAAGAQGPMIVPEESDARADRDSKGPLFLALEPDGPEPAQGNPESSASPPEGGPSLSAGKADGPSLNGQEAAQPRPDAYESPDLADIPPDQKALYREVMELKRTVDRLRAEAEVRDRLRVTTEEERDRDAEILEAAGREYSLRTPWTFGMDLNVSYSYNSYDIIRQIDTQAQIEYNVAHTINNDLSFESGVRDNLAIGVTIPFVYKYDSDNTSKSREVTNLGDISLRVKYQPLKTGRGYPSPIFSFSYTMPTGKSPYDINPATELSTGSGVKRIGGSMSLSQPFDPVNAFGSISYTHRLKEENIGQARIVGTLDKVDPGDYISASIGFGYAVSYRMSLSLSLSYSYGYSTDYYWILGNEETGEQFGAKTSSGDSVSASLGLTTAWRDGDLYRADGHRHPGHCHGQYLHRQPSGTHVHSLQPGRPVQNR